MLSESVVLAGFLGMGIAGGVFAYIVLKEAIAQWASRRRS